MADNYLITGYWGEPHVTAENDRGIHAGIFGTGKFVLPVGEQFRAEYIGNSTIRMYDGKLMDNGAAAGIPAGQYIDLLIPEAEQGMYRKDIIAFQYAKDASTLIESGTFIVVRGVESSTAAVDPELTEKDLLTGDVDIDQMALWRVSVSGTTISAPEQLFKVSQNLSNVEVELTKESIEKVLTGNITTHTHSQYLTSQSITGKLDKNGGTMTGELIAQNNTNYTTKQVRNIFLVADGASLPSGANGDICLVYTP